MVHSPDRDSEIENDPTIIEAELKRLLGAKRFAGAPMMSAFLRYIVTQKLEGNSDRIKAYTIGVDALGRPDSFDAQLDPSVRVLALRLRKCLKATYETSSAHDVRIELKVGTYVPEFYRKSSEGNGVADKVSTTTVYRDIDQPSLQECLPETHLLERSLTSDAQRTASRDAEPIRLTTAVQAPIHSPINRNRLIFLGLLLSLAVLSLLSLQTAAFSDRDGLFATRSSSFTVQLSGFHKNTNASASRENDVTPTLIVMNEFQASSRLQTVSAHLGRSVSKAGSVNVIFKLADQDTTKTTEHHYTMLLSEVLVDDQSRIDTQILRTTSGLMVSNATLLFDEATATPTGEELDNIEQLAAHISHVNGPMYKDFCRVHTAVTLAHCQIAVLPCQGAQSFSPACRSQQNQDV